MTRTIIPMALAALASGLVACAEAPLDPAATTADTGPQLAKPAPSTRPVELTILAGDLVGDGKGPYLDGMCGVFAKWGNLDVGGSLNFVPAGTSIPSSQTAACAGIAPRTVTLRLHTRHVSLEPHVDVTDQAGSGSFPVSQVASAVGGGTKINAPPACFLVSKRGSYSGRGLRFDADNYAGSDDLVREDLGSGLYRFSSPPGALAWCEDNSGISLWHVSVEFHAQVR